MNQPTEQEEQPKDDGSQTNTLASTSKSMSDNNNKNDPLLQLPSNVVRDGDHVILAFADGRQCFAQALPQKTWRGKHAPFKYQKKSYSTNHLIGLPYGTVLEINPAAGGLIPLPEGEDIVPRFPADMISTGKSKSSSTTSSGESNDDDDDAAVVKSVLEDENEANADDSTFPKPTADSNVSTTTYHDDHHHLHHKMNEQATDNRHLHDDNKSQGLDSTQIKQMIEDGTHGSDIVTKLVQNSSSFGRKTTFSQAKYIAKKQRKYQPRCRIIRCTPLSFCEAIYKNRQRHILNMREDTLGQLLSYSNISAGCQVLVYEQCMGVVTGAIAQRMGGYGQVLSLYETNQPSYIELIQKFNLSFAEHQSIKWIHTGDVFGRKRVVQDDNGDQMDCDNNDDDDDDPEKTERDGLTWPIPLQEHTREFLEKMKTDQQKKDFLKKRCARFARKLTRYTPKECNEFLFGSTSVGKTTETIATEAGPSDAGRTKWTRKCDSIILAVGKYDPTTTILALWEFLAPSSPFVIYSEYIEPLTECFQALQQRKLAINFRLSDTWMREYQVLPGRTHPSMNMSQSGGYLLTGIKLDPVYGQNEIDEELAKEIRRQIGGRRPKKKKPNPESDNDDNNNNEDNNNNNSTAHTKEVDSNIAKKQRTA
jgi:tRNA (adenine58-N1)-methyltransferase non-catalytic subunit